MRQCGTVTTKKAGIVVVYSQALTLKRLPIKAPPQVISVTRSHGHKMETYVVQQGSKVLITTLKILNNKYLKSVLADVD